MSGGGIQTSDWFAQNAPPASSTIPKGSSGAPKAPATAAPQVIPAATAQTGGDWFAANAPKQTSSTGATGEQPGFWKRLGQSLGLPTSQDELEQIGKDAADHPISSALESEPAVVAGKGVYDFGKRLVTNAANRGKEIVEAAQNIKEGGPVGANLGKAAYGMVNSELGSLPFVGQPAQQVGQDVADKNYSGAAGGATGIAAQILAPKVLEKVGNVVGKARAPLGDTVTSPRGTIPAESYTPAELKAYADENGIQVNAAQVTGHNLPRNLQTAGERATIGGTAIKQQVAASQASLADHVEGLALKMSPQTPDITTAGRVLKTNVQTALDTQLTKADANYKAVDEAAQGTTVDLKPVKETADRILSDSDILQKAGLDPKTATRVLKGIGALDDDASFADAQKLRSALLDLSRSPELAISSTAQGMLKQVIGATDSAMMDAASETPELQKAFRGANAHYEQIQDDFNSPRSPMNQILAEPDPNKVPQKLAAKGSIGGSPYNAELLDKYGISKAPIKAVILNDLYNRNFGLQGKTLGGYSDDFLSSVFDKPGELDSVYKTGAIARSIGLNVNPSGTAGATSAIEQVASKGGLIKGAKQTGAAKLTNSPHFNKWMLSVTGEPTRIPVAAMAGLHSGKDED